MNISEHITLAEATTSQTAVRLGIDNTPSPAIIQVMRATAEHVFEPLRMILGKPIRVSSFYRSPQLNKAVGGAATSQHVKGEAIDIQATGGATNAQLFALARKHLPFDQLIWEFGTDTEPAWVHVSWRPSPRGEVLKVTKAGTVRL